jgi:MFS family permease
MFFIFQPLYLQQLGANPVTIGAILGAAGIAMTVAHIPAGHLADKIGRKPLLLVAWTMGILATWVMALAPSLPFFVFGLLVYSLTAFVSSPMNSYITAARGKLSVGRAITMVSALYNSGAILGPWLGGQVGQNFGLQKIYIFAGSLFILSSVILVFIKSQPIDKQDVRLLITRWLIDGLSYQSIIFSRFFNVSCPAASSNYLQNQLDCL